jgi:hypothetical protein
MSGASSGALAAQSLSAGGSKLPPATDGISVKALVRGAGGKVIRR